jgi:hypothetical protein
MISYENRKKFELVSDFSESSATKAKGVKQRSLDMKLLGNH